jgi:hypothetical protein
MKPKHPDYLACGFVKSSKQRPNKQAFLCQTKSEWYLQ